MSTELNRRQFLVGSSVLAAFGTGALAACGGDSSTPQASPAAESAGTGDTGADKPGSVRVASWPFYIENDGDPKSAKTIVDFTVATGISVDYQVAIDGNDSFTAKYEGDLNKKSDIGFDVVVPTSWMAARWIQRGWCQPLPTDAIPNKVNLIDRLANPTWDAGRKFSVPGYIGQVGIAYYPDKLGFEVTSINDLLKPEAKGKVTLLSEMRDTTGLFLLGMGLDPATATVDEAKRAIEVIRKARDAGQFRKISGNSYIDDLGAGQVAASVAWSGDVASLQKQSPELHWVIPKEGGMSFVDTMCIPAGGNAAAAAAWINFLYDPKVSGPLMEAINYTSPVKGAGDAMSSAGRANPLVNPSAPVDLREFRDLSEAEAEELETAFAEATQQ